MNENFLHGIPTRLHFRVTRRGRLYQAQCVELPGVITTSTVAEERLRFCAEDALKEYLLALFTITFDFKEQETER